MQINVYLNFDGNCREAMTFYQSVLGGELKDMMAYANSPMEGEVPEDWRDKVMHVSLVAGGLDIMACDTPPNQYVKPQGYHMSIQTGDKEEGAKLFEAMADGGTIIMPFQETFWADGFGMLVDRFGINWMVNVEGSKMP